MPFQPVLRDDEAPVIAQFRQSEPFQPLQTGLVFQPCRSPRRRTQQKPVQRRAAARLQIRLVIGFSSGCVGHEFASIASLRHRQDKTPSDTLRG
ncbi:Hypothetical protein GOX0472 [Gluconobacter oxydans 621H]|uniref:Uncharacterized protein n=1 Tax=Gluconobacter oxydans (strain 621H) TaxID=290633 RepID=Q5FTP4_GLUOX|nr:Hypothetical protein GOX0472 [Gluconobacter oxydans 621H]